MEHFRKRSSAESRISFLERALTGLSTQRSKQPGSPKYSSGAFTFERVDPSDDIKGPLGLNLLYVPSEPFVDFIFVHGLGGGSRKTWAKTSNLYHYWPKEWLPRDPDFKHVRIHSFGYAAYWGERKSSVLEINDFARSLLGEIKNNPDIRSDDTRIVLIGHSMGGLVIKKAYIIAREDPAFQDIASRFHTLYFLATPHRGSDWARTLTNIIKVSAGPKAYLNDLEPNSVLISSINETFRHYAQDLQLWSFYETLQSNLILYNSMVVDKSSATLGYPHERIALLNADHRGVCKFDRPSDPNYRTIRNAFSTTVESITTTASRVRQEASRSDQRRFDSLLSITGPPEDDLIALEDARVKGSCEWLTSKPEFEEWRVSSSSGARILWLNGRPTSGKSILASHVIGHLEGHNLDCSYFFFKHGTVGKSSISDCLRSIAYQMALNNVEVRKRLLLLEENGMVLGSNDEQALWRKLFQAAVLRIKYIQPQYWVIDALDECDKFQSLFSMLSNVQSDAQLRIFITSRKLPDIERGFVQLGRKVTPLEVLKSDTVEDIKLFIAAKIEDLPVASGEDCAKLTDRILTKSEGSFLWVRLVMQELQHAWSEEGIEDILNEIPVDMNLLYARTLASMSKVKRVAKLAKAILVWTACSSRPLTLDEMQCALKIDINETIHSLDRSIAATCGQLVVVDHRSRIQMIHQTAKDFLFQEGLESEFAIIKSEGHTRLAVKCLEFLSGIQFKVSRSQISKHGTMPPPAKGFALADYACTFFSDHLYKSSPLQPEPWDVLYEFVNTNILSWIEYLAMTGDLQYITHTATNIKAFLDRRAQYFPMIDQQVRSIEAWSVDLIRVSAKFRTGLLMSPSSIHRLIPPMCPAESIIARQYTFCHRGLMVQGLKLKSWDDCLTQINYRGVQATVAAYGDRFFSVGLSDGQVMVYHNVSSQLNRSLIHGERVKILNFDGQSKVLASSGRRNVRVWDLSTGQQLWCFSTTHQALALGFTAEDECLMAATQGGIVLYWRLSDGVERARIKWDFGSRGDANVQRQRPCPTSAIFSPDHKLLAVSYRGYPIILYDLESEAFFGECARYSDLRVGNTGTHYPVVSMAFNPNPERDFLIISYGDGELILYDAWTLEPKHRLPKVNAQTIACSPDGRTFIAGGSFGTLQIFSISGDGDEGVLLIYCISADDDGIKSLAFSKDSLRFVDISGSQCRVWGPAVLVRKGFDECDQNENNDSVTLVHESLTLVNKETKVDITAIACHPNGDVIFCGKEDGSIMTFLAEDGKESGMLYRHAANIAITLLTWGSREGVLVSVDESSRIVIRRIRQSSTGWSASDVLVDQRYSDSVNGILLNSANDRLLVNGNQFDELWTMQGEKVGHKAFPSQQFHQIFDHPLHPETLVVLEPTTARIVNWKDLEELSCADGVRLNRCSDPIFGTSASKLIYHGHSVLVGLLKPTGYQSSNTLECWAGDDFRVDAKHISPLSGFEMLGPSIEHIIAVVGTRLLFLDTDLWVCSLDLRNFAATPEAKRHYFIPPDWRNSSGDVLFHLTSKNEFVFAKKNELIIIKRGLDYSELISLAKAQKRTINHGTSI